MPLKLSLPDPGTGLLPVVETDTNVLKTQLEGVLQQPTTTAAREIHDRLSATNRSLLAFSQVADLAECYDVMVGKILPRLAAEYATVAIPLPVPAQIAVNLERSLLVELAYLHKLHLLHPQGRLINEGSGDVLSRPVQRIMRTFVRLLAICCKVYAPVPPGVWQEFHELFRIAMQKRLLDLPEQGGPHDKIAFLYKHGLLLGVADPYRLMLGEVDKVLELIDQFGDQAQLQAVTPLEDHTGIFVIHLDRDAAPEPLNTRFQEPDRHNDLFLNTRAVSKALAAHVARQVKPGMPLEQAVPNADLLRRLVKQWGVTPRRQFQRIRVDAEVDVCLGLQNVCYFVNGETPVALPGAAQPAKNPAQPVAKDVSELLTSVLGEHHGHFELSQNWRVINESVGGMALEKQTHEGLNVDVGEVIGVKLRGPDSAWQVCLVRRMTMQGNQLELGLQLLAPGALTCLLHIPAENTWQAAITLPALPAIKQPASLLTRSNTWRPALDFELVHDGNIQRVRSGQTMEQNARFDWFGFVPQ